MSLLEKYRKKQGWGLSTLVAGQKLAVVLAISLCLTIFVFSEYSRAQTKSDAHVLNLAGRERMLSERVLSSLQVIAWGGSGKDEKQGALQTMERSLGEWRENHSVLLEKANHDRATSVLEAIRKADPARIRLEEQARVAIVSDLRLNVSLDSARDAQRSFVLAQEQVLTELEAHDEAQNTAGRNGHWISLSLLLITLIAQTLVIFRPLLTRQREAIKLLQDQKDQLHEAHEELSAQNASLIDGQHALEAAISRSDDMTRLSRFAAARFEELFAGLPIAAFTFDEEGSVFEWNREAEAMFSLRASQTVGRSIVELIALPENKEDYREMVEGVFAGDHIYNVERRIRRANGEIKLVLLNAFPLRDPEDRITGGVCSMVDITEQRLAEDRLRKSERRFREMVENLPTGAILVEGESIHINRYVERMTGFQKSELGTLDEWFETVYRERAFLVRSNYEADRSANFPTARIVPIETKDGRTRHIEFFAHREDSTEVWIMQDVSERLATHERFKVLFEYSSDAHLLFDETGIVDCNEATVRMLGGQSKHEILAQHPAVFSPEFQPDGSRSDAKCLEMDAKARDSGSHRFEWIHRKVDGTEFPVEVTLTPVQVMGKDTLLTVWHDLTEQKAAQEALQAAIEELNQAQAIARVGSWQCDGNMRGAWFSPEMRRILGREDIVVPYDLTELSKLVHPDDSRTFRRNLLGAVRRRLHWEQELRIRRPDGEERIIICTGKPLAVGTKYLGTIQDVTVARLQQQELMKQMSIANEFAITLEEQKIELEAVNEKLKALATTDGLTGISNHRRFQEYLEQEFAVSKRNGSALSLILLDVDHFKMFNDEFGHQAGDEVLRGVAQALQKTARGSDFVARYGGEEFVIVLPGADEAVARDAADRFRRVLDDQEWPYRKVTASFGVATVSDSIHDRESLIALTDGALYEAKRLGRNRVAHSCDPAKAA